MSRFPSASPFTAASSGLGHPSSPFTPSPSARARNGDNINHSPEQSQSSSTTFSESMNPSNRMDDITRSTFRNIFTSSSTTPGRHIIIRSDATLLTCFDPQDKELYDLWAPKK